MALLAAWVGVAPVTAATDYIYSIGTDWKLYQINVDSVANTVSTSPKLTLSNYISGWGSSGRNNEYINGLGIDQATGNIYFNYSYNSSSTATSGTMTVVPYIYQNTGGGYSPPYTLGAAINSPTLPATSVGAGWVPRATFYNGTYYAGIQNSDTFLVLPITGTTTKSYGTIASYSNWDHTSITSMQGGDFVIGSNSTIYGTTVISSANTFYRQPLANATNASSGAAWTSFNVDSSIPSATQGSIQIAGLGQSTNLYVISSTSGNIYKVNGYDNGTAPTFSQIGSSGVIPVTMTDFSIIVSAPLPVPEASTILGAAGVSAGVVLEFLRRRHRKGSSVAD